MSLEDQIRKLSAKQDHSEVQAEFGLSHEQAVEFTWRITRALWVGFQTGAGVMLAVVLVVLGGWELFRTVTR